jgi:anti-sigma regulatory factor (Ser/Thr protein kinase)
VNADMKPRQIWLAFAVCVMVVTAGMVWLSVRVVELNRAETTARREAEQARHNEQLQRRIAIALWRMDWIMAPIIAQEVARPSYVYQPFVPSPTRKGTEEGEPARVSPLLARPAQWVILNFDVTDDNQWSSPQIPVAADLSAAVEAGLDRETLAGNRRRLATLQTGVNYNQLLAMVPDAFLAHTIEREDGDDRGNVLAELYAAEANTTDPAPFQQAALPPADQSLGPRPRQADAPIPNRAQTRQAGGGASAQSGASQVPWGDQFEWERRNTGLQNVVRNQRAQWMSNNFLLVPDLQMAREGVSRPLWVDAKLILARRVVSDGRVRIQGSWLDWTALQNMLISEVADLLPQVSLLPVTQDSPFSPGRMATLPVQLSVPDIVVDDPSADYDSLGGGVSAIDVSLWVAWSCLGCGALAIAVMLHGVLKLSERRGAFVSAVTHELRSPLTTFRMYAEMLAEGMVRDEQQRIAYLDTLRREAERLAHLVDNVLQYARLERRGPTRHCQLTGVPDFVRFTTQRLPLRAQQANMVLCQTILPDTDEQYVRSDAAAVEQILFNLVDNACKYAAHAADRRIHLEWATTATSLSVQVRDHGPGIAADRRKRLFQPFSKTDQEAAQSAPGIGLGLALCQRLARQLGGRLAYQTAHHSGAAFVLEIPLGNARP